uniref:Uncharacterized protein n=1 Tax=Otus sunia TaxID=257818 RepID=A0A8C8BHH1_9STRI
ELPPQLCRLGCSAWQEEEKRTATPGTETARWLPEPADTRRRGARRTSAFPRPGRSPAPCLPPSRTSPINSLSRLTWPGEKEGGRHRAKETYILCGHR